MGVSIFDDPFSITHSLPMTVAILQESCETPQTQDMASEEVGELVDLLHLADQLPTEYRTGFYRALNRLVEGFERRQRILGYIQESLGQMNLDLKYLIFDLEATRRERDEYRRQLESVR
jgi:hypothetical protein